MFKEKNEAHLSGGLAFNNAISGEIQAAYAVTKNVGIIANANILQPPHDKLNNGGGYLYEIGAGYFKPLNVNTKHAKNVFVFELYGLVGLGGYRNFYWDSTGLLSKTEFGGVSSQRFFYPNNYIRTQFVKSYVQPSIAFSHNIIDFIISAKIGFLANYKITTTIPGVDVPAFFNGVPNPYTGSVYDDWAMLHNNTASFLFEPSATVRVGWKYVKLQLQCTYTVGSNPFLNNLDFPITFSAGLSLNLAPRFLKARKN